MRYPINVTEQQEVGGSREITKTDYFLVFMLLITSGNPFIASFKWAAIILAVGCLWFWTRNAENKNLATRLFLYSAGVIVIFIFQTLILGWNTLPGIVNFLSKLIWGGSVFLFLGSRFKYTYLKVITILAGLSLICWGLSLFGIYIPGVECTRGWTNIIYTYIQYNPSEIVLLRNSGFAWEPGAFGCYLVLTLILFFNDMGYLWRCQRKSSIIIICAILSTASTTAYVAMAIVICSYLLLKVNSKIKYAGLIAMIAAAIYAGQELEFLNEKIDTQFQAGLAANGKFNSTRFGSFLFDWHYIEKHPLFGNGLHSRTRYADHKRLVKAWEKGEEEFSGNGFSDILAAMGVLFLLLYFWVLFSNNRNELSTNDKIIVAFGIILLLFGEPLMGYPLFLGLPLVSYEDATEE